jgi:hypothetical protein
MTSQHESSPAKTPKAVIFGGITVPTAVMPKLTTAWAFASTSMETAALTAGAGQEMDCENTGSFLSMSRAVAVRKDGG